MSLELINIFACPLVAEAMRAGRGFVLKLTDSLQVAAYPGQQIALRRTCDQEEDGPHLALAVPFCFANASKYERCFVRGLSCEMSSVEEPDEGSGRQAQKVSLPGAFLLDRVDVLQEECRLAAELLRNDSAESREALRTHAQEHRRMIDAEIVEANQVRSLVAEFRCPVAEGLSGNLARQWEFRFFAGILFPSTVVERVAIASFNADLDFPLRQNSFVLCFPEYSKGMNWREATPLV